MATTVLILSNWSPLIRRWHLIHYQFYVTVLNKWKLIPFSWHLLEVNYY